MLNAAIWGLIYKPLQDLETFYTVDINQGVLVNSVDRNGAAQKAGLQFAGYFAVGERACD